eukprot:GHVS01069209.1.p1 GENE.GHVS01069209.1~~GHVS01069209.1.p1  ORF type:complete len:785 (-),score=94.16 GHVS01069209.1:370-2724(-)
MMSDPHRGYLLEILLTKICYFATHASEQAMSRQTSWCSEMAGTGAKVQIVGMSATLPNGQEVSQWLQAHYYSTDFRPVPLVEYYLFNQRVYVKPSQQQRPPAKRPPASAGKHNASPTWSSKELDMRVLRRYALEPQQTACNPAATPVGTESEWFTVVCFEELLRGNSVLVFCATKRQTELVALQLSVSTADVPAYQPEPRHEARRRDLVEELGTGGHGKQETPSSILRKTVPKGIAFHHSGLTVQERHLVETAYRTGAVRLLVATSTLAAGVNLPASRVVFRSPHIARDFLDPIRYKQMSGRAGRTGQGAPFGESIVMCSTGVSPGALERLMTSPLPRLRSALTVDKQGLHRLILEVLASHCDLRRGDATSVAAIGRSSDLVRLSECTLLLVQKRAKQQHQRNLKGFEKSPCDGLHSNTVTDDTKNESGDTGGNVEELNAREQHREIYDAMQFLLNHGQVTYDQRRDRYECTKQGKGVVVSGLSPWEGYIVYTELESSMTPILLADGLHLVYLITPISGGFCTTQTSAGRRGSLRPSYSSDMFAGLRTVDWSAFSRIVSRLSTEELRVFDRLNIYPSTIEAAHRADQEGRSVTATVFRGDNYAKVRYSRMYSALALVALMRNYPLPLIAKTFAVTAGDLQSLQTTATSFAGRAANLCDCMGLWIMSSLIRDLMPKISITVNTDILPLLGIRDITAPVARELYRVGYRTLASIAWCQRATLERDLMLIRSRMASDGGAYGADASDSIAVVAVRTDPVASWAGHLIAQAKDLAKAQGREAKALRLY